MDPLDEYTVGAGVVVRRTGSEGRVAAVYPHLARPIRLAPLLTSHMGPTMFSPHELRLSDVSNAERARLRRLEEAVIELVVADMDGTDPREKRGLYLRVALLSGVEDRGSMGRIPHDFDHGPAGDSVDCWLCGEGAQYFNHTDRDTTEQRHDAEDDGA